MVIISIICLRISIAIVLRISFCISGACNQLVILTSSSPLSFVNCMKFESASSPSPLKGRPCHAKTFMFDKIFRKLCRHSNLLLVALADSDSAIYLRVVSSVIVLMTTSS